jgi:quercetin dioxygenase-like cupin family protein
MEIAVTRLYTGTDGESHMEEKKIPVKEFNGLFRRTDPIDVKQITFSEGYLVDKHDWHNPPVRQFIIILDGEIEVELIDGTSKKFGPGSVILAEDTTGRGHIVHPSKNMNHRAVAITLE